MPFDATTGSRNTAMATSYRYDAFLSHNSKDKALVEPIARALLQEGLQVFYDAWDMPGGRPNDDQIDTALDESRAVLVFLGPNGFGPIHRDEARSGGDLANREGRVVMLVLLPGADSEPVPRALRNRGRIEFKTLDVPHIEFKRGVWECVWSVTGNKPAALDALQKLPPAASVAPKPSTAAAPDAGLLQRFDRAARSYGAVLLLGRSWDAAQRGDEPARLARSLLPKLLNDPLLAERPLRPPLDDIASCAGEVEGEDWVCEALQAALGVAANTAPARALPDAVHAALSDCLQQWLRPAPAGPDESSLLLLSTAMGLGVEQLLFDAGLPFVRVVLQSQGADPQLVVHDCLDATPSLANHLGRSLQRLLPDRASARGPALTAQLSDLLPRGHGKRHAVLVKGMGSVDLPESCLLARGQVTRFAELLGRGCSLHSYLQSALASRAVLMAGLRVLDDDFTLLRSLVLDPAFRKGALRPRLWVDPGRPPQANTLAEHAEQVHGEAMGQRLPGSLLGVSALANPLPDVLRRLGQLAAAGAAP